MADEPTTTTATTADPAPAATPAAPVAAPDFLADPKVAAYVKELRDEAAKFRIAAKTATSEGEAKLKAIAQALGLGNEPADPVKLQETLAARDAELRQVRTEGKVRSMASKVSADAEALLDSRSFVKAIASLDPTADDFEADMSSAIQAAISSNPKLKIAAPGALRGGAEINGASPTARTFSRAQLRDTAFYEANQAEINIAFREGRITD